jgi:hypothetical protein
VIHNAIGKIGVRYFAAHLQRDVVAFLTPEQLERFPYKCRLAWTETRPALEHDRTTFTVCTAVGGYLIARRHRDGCERFIELQPGDFAVHRDEEAET